MVQFMNETADAYAQIRGDAGHCKIKGNIYFFEMYGGTLVVAEVEGLPNAENAPNANFYGFHIHEGALCTGDEEDPFAQTKGHYNPENTVHPEHAGDFPPLLANEGLAWSAFYTDRFYPEEVIGRTVVIHGMADDFRTQSSGNSGSKIACGEIVSE